MAATMPETETAPDGHRVLYAKGYHPKKSSSPALRAAELFSLLTDEAAGAGQARSCSST